MPISQTTITGSVKTPGNLDAAITGITFTLTKSDYEAGEIIAKNTVNGAVIEADGDFSVTLWPNDKGMNGDSKYKMKFTFGDGSTVDLAEIYVKHSDTPKTIEDVALETKLAGALKGYTAVVLTQTQYDALATKSPTTAYILKGV